MKIPDDAVVEWRCTSCGKLYGYARHIDGEIAYTTITERLDEGPRLAEVTDRRLSWASRQHGIRVGDGRHWATARPDDFTPRFGRRVVPLTPDRPNKARKTPPPGVIPALDRARLQDDAFRTARNIHQ